MTTGETHRRCVVDGCDQDATEPPVDFNGATLLLCSGHRADVDTDPLVWDGELDPTGDWVRRLWRREGIGSAS